MRFSQLKELVNNIVHKKISDKEKKRWARNEFDYIQMILDESIKESISVRKNALSYRKTLFQQAAILIFHGLLRERKEIQSVLKVCGTELCEEFFFLYGLKMDNEKQLERLHEFFQGDIHYVLNEDGRKFIFVLCELPYVDFNMRKRHELAEKLQAVLGSVGISCNQIAMSQVYHQISMASYAYLEVFNILENASSKRARVLCWEEWTRLSGKVSVWVDDENLKEFREAVFEKDLERALSVLSSALKQKRKKKEDVLFLRYMLLQVLALEVNISVEEENQNLLDELGEINLDDGTAFESDMRHILQEYCRKEVPSSEREFAKALQFVEDNYTSFDLSLERVAEYLGISRSQMSKLFKSQIGVGYIDYVNQLRMQKAKELLAETDMNVKEIFRKVGYIDATNARKKFKVYWGMNPTEYRAMMQNGKPEEINEPEIDENVSETEGE